VSKARPRASQNLARDATKKKKTVKHTARPPVALAPTIINAPLYDDISTQNMFDTMPDRYGNSIFGDFLGGLVRLMSID
jgi:hypothetical protein